MARTDPEVRLRLSPEMKDRITRAAKIAGRSMNAEIERRLEASFVATSGNLDEWHVEREHLLRIIETSTKLIKAHEQSDIATESMNSFFYQAILEAYDLLENTDKIDAKTIERWRDVRNTIVHSVVERDRRGQALKKLLKNLDPELVKTESD